LTVEVPGIIPKLSATPGMITRRGPMLGEDTQAVLDALQHQLAARKDLP
jgi:formyl-CoA transferase